MIKPTINELDEHEMQWMEFTELMYSNSDSYSEEMVLSLKAAMKQLPLPDYEILMAVDFEGYTFREIAEETGTPEGTLMSRRHRALAKLNKALKDKKEHLEIE